MAVERERDAAEREREAVKRESARATALATARERKQRILFGQDVSNDSFLYKNESTNTF